MKIKILNGCKGREVNSAIMVEVLLDGRTLTMNHPHVSFDVPDWKTFCGIVWRAYCLMSRDARGSMMSQRVGVDVYMENGGMYATSVWYDEQCKGLRYVSLM